MTDQEQVAALVRAIRRAHLGEQYGGIERFVVSDIHAFAQKLVEVGVTVQEKAA